MNNKLLRHYDAFCKTMSLLLFFGCMTSGNAQIIAESFEGENFPPPGWTVGPNWSLATWSLLSGDASHGNNSTSHYTVNQAGVTGFIITPPVMLQAGQQIQISFDYSILDSDGGQANLLIGSTSVIDDYGNAFDPAFETLDFIEMTDYDTHTVSYTATENGVKYFYFNISSEWNHPFSIVMDKIIIENVTGCSPVTNLSASAVTATSASINWNSPIGVSEWQIQITQGSLPLEANWVSATASPLSLNGLTPGTDYTVYVRSKCDEVYSYITDPVSFTTPCQDIISAPYGMNFSQKVLPDCWTEAGDTEWQFNTFADYGADDAGDHTLLQGETNYAWIDGTDNTDGLSATLMSPTIDVSELESPALEFFAYSSNKEGNVYNELLVEVFDGTTWEPVAILDEASNGWKFYSIDLNPDAINVQARFTVSGNGELTYYNDILLDDISFKGKTICYPIQDISANNITATTIGISGESENTDATWDIAYDTYQEVFNGVPDLVGVELPYTLTNLEASTYYYIYLRANCGDEIGNWTGPFAVMTDCIVYTSPYIQDFTSNTFFPFNFDLPGFPECWSEAIGGNFTMGPSEFGTGNWKPDRNASAGMVTNSESVSAAFFGSTDTSWLLSPIFDLAPDNEYEAVIRIAIGASMISPAILSMGSDDVVHFAYSYDGAAWETLYVWSSENVTTSGYNSAIVPLDELEGEVRFAFIVNEGQPDNMMYQFHVDNFELRPKTICPEPLNLIADGMTDQTAVLSWDAVDEVSSWEIAVVSSGTTPVSTDFTPANTNPYIKTGLTSNTEYDFYVKSVCGGAISDVTSGPVKFSTRCAPITAPYTETFIDYQMLPSCWIMNPVEINMQIFFIYFWNFTTAATADAATAGDHTEGGATNYAWLSTGNYINNERATLTTPIVDIAALENPAFQFYLFSENSTDDALNHVTVKIFSGTEWQELTKITSHTNGWAEHTLDLSPFASETPVQIQFEISINANGGFPGYNQILIDDVSFIEMPSCPAPFNISIDDVTTDSAFVNWENANAAGPWQLEYGPVGFTPGEGTIVEVTDDTEAMLSGLNEGETYDIYITAICDGTVIGPATFTTEIASGIIDSEVFGITCYPNPASDVLNVKSDFVVDTVEMYNIFGQLIKKFSPKNTVTEIEVGMLSSGMYLIKAYSGEKVSIFRIIKN